MKTRRLRSGGRGSARIHPDFSVRKDGFTLVELMMAVSISIMVFAAMGVLLTRCFSLWVDATAHWRLAQTARISRERILSGGFADPSGGMLSATNVHIVTNSFALNVGYATDSGFFGVCGYTNIVQPRLYLLKQDNILPYWVGGYSDWRWGVRADKAMPVPEMELHGLDASLIGDVLTLTYRLQFSAAGRTFSQPHTVRARLVNME